ncbi:group 1 truncated hemoglobin [Parasulfuritortus cantonensis]|uniref:Group 1 truncated hemoglobin n=1 Tax=Parasulfuritortus cantonensis TaxID=2528202 RepID=A0A4V2NV35_9PROT|nr:group 1 truncated hemoglobin [Parasulfuritortus cantonensis]TCJ11906.1 group 1 truncated hemoglobin [Parasulfuritortus cantonensis]
MNAPTETAVETVGDTATLYERLGGRPGIEAIVEDIWNNHVSNPLVNKRYVNSDPANVKRLVTEMCCAGFGGPESYTGRDMIAAHKGMNINDTEFVAVCDDVLKALDKHNVGKRERDEILCILYSLKNDVVYQ